MSSSGDRLSLRLGQHVGWLEAGSDSPSGEELSEVLLTHLSGSWWDCPLGPQLGPLVRSPASDLSMWLLGSLTAWRLASKSTCHQRRDVEAATFLRPGPRTGPGSLSS